MQVFAESCVIHDGTLYRNTLFFSVQIDYIIKKWSICRIEETYEFLSRIEETYEFLNTFIRVEYLTLVASVFFFLALVCKSDCDALIQICKFSKTCLKYVVFIFGYGEY